MVAVLVLLVKGVVRYFVIKSTETFGLYQVRMMLDI